MHLAAAQGHVDMVELLAGEGCDVSPVDRFGRTPLHEAAINRHGGCVEALKRLGATLRLPEHEEASLLCNAAATSDAGLLASLLAAGALPSACDRLRRPHGASHRCVRWLAGAGRHTFEVPAPPDWLAQGSVGAHTRGRGEAARV